MDPIEYGPPGGGPYSIIRYEPPDPYFIGNLDPATFLMLPMYSAQPAFIIYLYILLVNVFTLTE